MADRTHPDFAAFRAGFAGAADSVYLDVADRGLISDQVQTAVASFLERCAAGEAKDAAVSWVASARRGFAQLVRAGEDEIALTKNVSDGINAVANAVDWRAGDNVVLCEPLEHPSNLRPWTGLRDRRGVAIRNVEPHRWAIDPERVASAIDDRTRIVSVSMVTFAPGFRTDVESIGAACRARGVLFLIDAAQSAGVLDIDLSRLPVDALAAGTPKALLGLYGMGFLYVRQAVADALHPTYMSGQGTDRSGALKPGAGRFDVGNPNHVGCAAAAVSISQLQALGTESIERHATALARTLAEGFTGLGLPVMQPPNEAARSNIVTIGSGLEADLDSTSDERLQSLHRYLTERRVKLSVRRGVLRFSLHAYNTDQDVAQVLERVQAWQRG